MNLASYKISGGTAKENEILNKELKAKHTSANILYTTNKKFKKFLETFKDN